MLPIFTYCIDFSTRYMKILKSSIASEGGGPFRQSRVRKCALGAITCHRETFPNLASPSPTHTEPAQLGLG